MIRKSELFWTGLGLTISGILIDLTGRKVSFIPYDFAKFLFWMGIIYLGCHSLLTSIPIVVKWFKKIFQFELVNEKINGG